MPDLRPLLAVFLVACGPGWIEDEVDGFRRWTATVRAGGDGQRPLRIDPEEGETSMLLTVEAEAGLRTHVVDIEADGEVIFDAVAEAETDRATTNAGYLSPVATLNWPRNGGDTLMPLKVTVGSVSAQSTYTRGTLDLTVHFARDADGDSGTLPVVLVYAGGTDQDAGLVAAVEEALEGWREIYGTVGIELDVSQGTWPDGDLDVPVDGTDPAWTEMADAFGPRTVNVVIAPSIAAVDDVLGIAGDIPGPMAATTRSGVLISALDSAGTDGSFSALETRLLGETMAHEVGHYLGLYHPVETTWDRWDALDDTAECSGENRCVNLLSDLLMFPFPVCGFGGCGPQGVLTDDQATAIHGYTGLR